MKRSAFAPIFLLAMAAPLQAQQPAAPVPVERIYAVVGDSIILEGEIREELERTLDAMRERGETVPSDSATLAAMRKDIVDQLVDRLVLLQVALRDSVLLEQMDDNALNDQVDQEINERRQRFGGHTQFEAALAQQRLTYNEYREMLLTDLRKQALTERLLQRLAASRKPPPISDRELRDEFEKAKSSLPARPPTLTFQQVVLLPRANDDALARARAKADSILTLLRAGGDFEAIAKRESDDPGSRDQGGLLGWARPASTYVKEFADAIMYLRPGETSPLVETPYGFHIIRLEKIRGPEYQVRHILIAPQAEAADFERTLERGQEVAAKARAGADMDSLHRAVGDLSEIVTRLGPVDRGRLGQISPEYDQLATAKAGDVIGPFGTMISGQRKVVVVKVIDVHEGGEFTYDDPVLNFRRQIQQRRLIDEVIGELRRQTYIEIRA